MLAVRVIVFSIVWLVTWGKLSFWLLPNLTEDVGFFDSFRPAYECTFNTKSDGDDQSCAVPDKDGGGADLGAEGVEDEEKLPEDRAEDDEEDENNADEDQDVDDELGNDSIDDDDDVEEQSANGGNDNGYEMISAEDVENGSGRHGDEVAAAADDDDGERRSVRRRKGKRRIT